MIEELKNYKQLSIEEIAASMDKDGIIQSGSFKYQVKINEDGSRAISQLLSKEEEIELLKRDLENMTEIVASYVDKLRELDERTPSIKVEGDKAGVG